MAGATLSKTDLAKKKAFELSYALLRISSKSGNLAFKEHIEQDATDLLDSTIKGRYSDAKAILEHIDYFMGLGSSSGIVSTGNAEILFRESKNLNNMVSGIPDISDIEDPEIANIFSVESGNEKKKRGNPEMKVERIIESGNGDDNPEIATDVQGRRDSILKIIRQSGNCRIKDMQDSLPDVSDRTIRYDLEIMIHDGLVERMGSGPGTYYKIPENRALASTALVNARE